MNKQFDEAEKVESLLKKDFSETEYAFYLTDEKTGYENEEAKLYNNGRNLLFKNGIEGLSLLKELIKNSEKSDIIISSAFSIAYYYDKVAEIDSSHKYYSFISDSYPDTDHSIRAKDRLFILNGILSLTNPDSSKIDSKQ